MNMRQFDVPRPGILVGIAIALLIILVAAGRANLRVRYGGHATGGRDATVPHPVPSGASPIAPKAAISSSAPPSGFRPRMDLDISGYGSLVGSVPAWNVDASLETIAALWTQPGLKLIPAIDADLKSARTRGDTLKILSLSIHEARLFASEGEVRRSEEILREVRSLIEADEKLAREWLYTITYLQGVIALRRGENDNCIACRGESSCILPIAPAAIHTIPDGSRLAIRRFSEYLERFPDDLDVRWLLNLAHMTLGEHPGKVDPRYLISLDRFRDSEFDIGKFRDVGHLVGVNRFNQAGGAIMEDFDNDGLLDLAVSCFDPTEPLSLYRNKGDGVFEDRSKAAGVTGQLGGLYCVQTDYNNDGRMDIFIVRGAWLRHPIRPSLLRNNADGTFTDVTGEAGLSAPVNSITASWADYDNDGWLDLFVGCERQLDHLYHNRGDGTFEDATRAAGLIDPNPHHCKGSSWVDFDNDDFPDLFLNDLARTARLYRNNRDGTFRQVTTPMGIDGPAHGFSCWAWDYDNDGWLDIFATCGDRTLADVVKGLIGQPHGCLSNRLFHNVDGKRFEDRTKEAGLDLVFATMGSNYGDFDNDGFLDMYLGTGDPSYTTLIPNRMFKNVDGVRFAEITGSTRTGHLQKGHAVACGDWDRDGDVDLFVETGGAMNGDKYHNVLFQNPGQGNHWLTVKLVGKKTNRAAIGARIKVVTAGAKPMTVHRHVSSGSSFGANPLEQTVGLAGAQRVALLEIHWPTSGTTQVFRDIAADQAIEVTEFAESYRRLDWKPVPQPK